MRIVCNKISRILNCEYLEPNLLWKYLARVLKIKNMAFLMEEKISIHIFDT